MKEKYGSGKIIRLEWLSKDNLSHPPFALVTYMTSFYKIRSKIQG